MLRRLVPIFLSASVALAGTAGPAGADDGRARAALVGGAPAAATVWPGVAYVSAPGRACTGALITTNAIVTAAHCVVDAQSGAIATPEAVTVRTGSHSLFDARATISTALTIYVDGAYMPASAANDIAVVILTAAVPDPQLRLITAAEAALLRGGMRAEVSGWGLTMPRGQPSPDLQTAPLALQSSAWCEAALRGTWFERSSMLCATSPSRSVSICDGDSGGPLVVTVAAREWRIAGVSSWSRSCAVTAPSVFARVDRALPWIGQALAAHPASPLRTPDTGSGAVPQRPRPTAWFAARARPRGAQLSFHYTRGALDRVAITARMQCADGSRRRPTVVFQLASGTAGLLPPRVRRGRFAAELTGRAPTSGGRGTARLRSTNRVPCSSGSVAWRWAGL